MENYFRRLFFVSTFASSTNDKAIFDLLIHSNDLKTQSLELCSLATVGTQEQNNILLITRKRTRINRIQRIRNRWRFSFLATSGTQEFIHNNNYDKITLITAISFQEKTFVSLKTTI